MQKFITLFLILLVALSAVTASAADRGPQRQTTAITTNASPAAIALPLGDTGRFDPAWLIVGGDFAGTTQTISYVAGAYTGALAQVTAPAVLAITNVPTQFSGDVFLMTTTGLGTNTLSATIIGRVFD